MAQTLAVSTAGDVLRVRAGTFGFIEGAVLDRLRDGRSARLDLMLSVLDRAGGRTLTSVRQTFNVSFDLWEERVAVTRAGTSPRSVSHLTPKEAETWCLDALSMPLTDLA